MNKYSCLFCLQLLIFSLFFSPVASAQQPLPDSLISARADSLPSPSPVLFDSLSYRFIGDGNFTWGNVNRSLTVLRAELTLNGPAVSLATNPRFTYGEQNNRLAERDTYVDLLLDVFKKKKVYVFGLATVERSNLRRIDWRQLAGAGVGFRLIESSRNTLTLTNAIIYESTNFRERPTLATARNSTRVKGRYRFGQDKIRLTHVTFVQPALSDFSNLRWNTLISLELPLNRWVTLRSSFENSYESVVEATRQKNDSRLTFGFAVGNRP